MLQAWRRFPVAARAMRISNLEILDAALRGDVQARITPNGEEVEMYSLRAWVILGEQWPNSRAWKGWRDS